MKCLRCGAAIDLGKPACPSCGHPLDADGDGVPDAIGKLMEEKARAAVEAERERVAREGRDASRRADEERATAELTSKRGELARARTLLEKNVASPRRFVLFNAALAVFFFVLALGLAGCSAGCVEPAVGHSFIAGDVFCPGSCDGCRGPGRIFTWHESSGGSESDVSSQVCHNKSIDVDALKWMDVTDEDDPRLEPYRMTLWKNFLVDVPLAFVLLVLLGPFVAGWLSRRNKASTHRSLVDLVASLEKQVAAAERLLGKPAEAGEPYR